MVAFACALDRGDACPEFTTYSRLSGLLGVSHCVQRCAGPARTRWCGETFDPDELRLQVSVQESLDCVRSLSLFLHCPSQLMHPWVLACLHVRALLVLHLLLLLLHLVLAHLLLLPLLHMRLSHSNSWSDTGRFHGPTGTRSVKGGVSGPAEDLRPVSEVEAEVKFSGRPAVYGGRLQVRFPEVCGTTRSRIWVRKGSARTRMLPENLDHLRVGWISRGTYETAWVAPGHDCLCSFEYGHGAAVRPQTNNAIWDGVIGFVGAGSHPSCHLGVQEGMCQRE